MTSSKNGSSQKNKIPGIVILCAIAVLIVVGILGFRDGGWFRGGKNDPYDTQNMQSLTDYAKQLEDAGNSEAAAAVYELIAKYGDGALVQKANEEIPVVKADNALEQFKRFVSESGKGDDK